MSDRLFYDSPIGWLEIVTDEEYLLELSFAEKESAGEDVISEPFSEIQADVVRWLDQYFQGIKPDFMPALKPEGSDFRKAVGEIMLTIPYGETMTYGDIAKLMAEKRGVKKMSAQAVGGAVGHNPIAIMIPCHRVIGAGGKLTGYGGGLDRKEWLLQLEGISLKK